MRKSSEPKLSTNILKYSHLTVTILCALVFLMLTVVSVLSSCDVIIRNDNNEKVVFLNDNILLNIIMLIVFAVLFYLLNAYQHKISYRAIYIFVTVFVLITGLIWVFSARTVPSADSHMVSYTPKEFSEGNYQSLTDDLSYFKIYPFQLGFTFFNEILYRFIPGQDHFIILQFLNVCYLAITYGVILNIIYRLFHHKTIFLFTSVFLIGCLQAIIFTTFCYGNLAGLMFAMLSILYAIRYFQEGSKKYTLLSALWIGLSVMVKLNNSIVLIALCIFIFLDYLKKKSDNSSTAQTKFPYHFVFLFLVIFAGHFLLKFAIWQYEFRSHEKIGEGIPMLSYLAMGMTPNEQRAPGWYNKKMPQIYIDAHRNSNSTNNTYKRLLNKQLNVFLHSSSARNRFFYKKLVSQWNDPSFQSIWDSQVRNHYRTPGIIAQYVCVEAEQPIKLYMGFYQQFLLLGCFLCMLYALQNNHFQNVFLIFPVIVLGGILYHLLFEAKAQYALTYYIMMIPMAAVGWSTGLGQLGKLLFFTQCSHSNPSNSIAIIVSL